MASAMLSHTVDYSRWKYCLEKTASYFSVYSLINKTAHAIAIAIAIALG